MSRVQGVSSAVSGDGGSAVSGDGGSAVSGDGGSAVSGDGGSAVSGDGGSAGRSDHRPLAEGEGAVVGAHADVPTRDIEGAEQAVQGGEQPRSPLVPPAAGSPATGSSATGSSATGSSATGSPATGSSATASSYPLAVGELIEEPSTALPGGGLRADPGAWPVPAERDARLRPWQLGGALVVAALVGAVAFWLLRPAAAPVELAAAPGSRTPATPVSATPVSPASGSPASGSPALATAPGASSAGQERPAGQASEEGAAVPAPAPTVAPGPTESPSNGAGADEAQPADQPGSFAVRVSVEPESAVLRLDGTPVAVGEVSLDLPLNGRTRFLRISAEGFLSQTLRLKDAALEQHVSLEPAPRRARRPWRRPAAVPTQAVPSVPAGDAASTQAVGTQQAAGDQPPQEAPPPTAREPEPEPDSTPPPVRARPRVQFIE